jgi:hypothetical protein
MRLPGSINIPRLRRYRTIEFASSIIPARLPHSELTGTPQTWALTLPGSSILGSRFPANEQFSQSDLHANKRKCAPASLLRMRRHRRRNCVTENQALDLHCDFDNQVKFGS